MRKTPLTAGGMPNVGLFVGMNLPVYHKKLAAGVCEAQARAAADRALYDAERNQSNRDIKGLFVQARAQQNIINLLKKNNLPAAEQVLRLTSSEYRASVPGVDFLSVVSALARALAGRAPDRPGGVGAGQDAGLARAGRGRSAQRASARSGTGRSGE